MLTLDSLIAEIVKRRLFILQQGALWSPNTHVPMPIRQAIRYHRRELCELIAEGNIAVCPARDLHRKSYRYIGQQRYICDLCLELQAHRT